MQAKFRVRFRITCFNYLELVQWLGDDTCFARWCGVKSNNKMYSPIGQPSAQSIVSAIYANHLYGEVYSRNIIGQGSTPTTTTK